MTNQNKLGIGLLILAVIAIAWFMTAQNKDNQSTEDTGSDTTNTSSEEDKMVVGSEKDGVSKGPSDDQALSYQEVVEKYKDFRIQFDTQCNAEPSSVTYKNGESVMFDNRSDQSRQITVEGKAYTISEFGFIVLPLSASDLPHSVQVYCDSQFNVAQILLQQ